MGKNTPKNFSQNTAGLLYLLSLLILSIYAESFAESMNE